MRFVARVMGMAIGLLGIGAGAATAQQVIYCGSDGSRPQFCRMDTSGSVRVLQQISQAPCREGQSYRVSRDGIEVRNGCRATFQNSNYVVDPGWGTSGSYERVRCESINGQTRTCSMNTRNGVRLEQELSSTPCIRNQNWFKEREGVRVTRGCRAVFGANRDWDEGGGWGGSGGSSGLPDRVRCESTGPRRYCQMETRYGVNLDRQLSGSPCRRGREWDMDRDRIWVEDGCRAEFVSVRGGGSGGGWGGSGGSGAGYDRITCESRDYNREYCDVARAREFRISRELNGSKGCREGRDWGTSNNAVWVQNGCRAEFRRN